MKGVAFDIDEAEGRVRASALRFDDDNGRIWAAKLENGDSRIANRRWITDLFVEQRTGSFVRFGAQLVCDGSANDVNFEHSRPNVVRGLLNRLAGEADGEGLSNTIEQVGVDGIDQLISLIARHDRRLPVVLVSVDDEGRAEVDLNRLSNRLSGTAHLRSIGIDASFALSDTVGKQLSTFNGAVRIYMPGLGEERDDPFQHPLWLASRSDRKNPRLINEIAARVLPLGFRDTDGDTRFWRLGLLRQATSRLAASQGDRTREEQLIADLEVARADADAAREAERSAEALMYDEAQKLMVAQSKLARISNENDGLRARLWSADAVKGPTATTLSSEDVRAVFDQGPTLEVSLRVVASMFSDRIVILDTAYDSARASADFLHKKKAFDLLWSLASSYWESLVGGGGDGLARQCFGAAYAAKESEKLSKSGRSRRTFIYLGEEVLMERHIKIGTADNLSDTLRIHFEWKAQDEKIVVGHCGGHLDF